MFFYRRQHVLYPGDLPCNFRDVVLKSTMGEDSLEHLKWHRIQLKILKKKVPPSGQAQPQCAVFQAIIKGATTRLAGAPDEEIVFHAKNIGLHRNSRAGEKIDLEVLFFRKDLEYANNWRQALSEYLSSPEGGRNYELIEAGSAEERSIQNIRGEVGGLPEDGELCLEFVMPMPFQPEPGRDRTFISREKFVQCFERRLSRLFGKSVLYRPGNDDFSVLPYYWNYVEMQRASVSQPGNTQFINGCAGKVYIKGRFGGFLPFVLLGAEAHAGARLSCSQGYYRIRKDRPGFFSGFFPEKRAVLSALKDVLEKYDGALESLSEQERYPFDEDAYSEKIFTLLKQGAYIPSPHAAFAIMKKDGSQRTVERPGFTDLIVQQYVLKMASTFFDRMFEEGSIGYRKGISRQRAVELVKDAADEGFRFVIESDIEDFFPSVDLSALENILHSVLPEADGPFAALIMNCARTGFVMNGELHARTAGLAQGAPLSPMLANLFMDSFDEHVEGWGMRLVRYADDFVILTKTMEEAEKILSQTESYLSTIGLKLKKEKTSIKEIAEGFSFLGLEPGGTQETSPEEEARKFRKPLYITEPFVYLAASGEAVDVRKDGKVLETVPLRRISEILAMERAAISTALIKKCSQCNVPITLTLDNGYFVATIKPDLKSWYDVSFLHAKRYYSLTETETLCIAKEFATAKVKNYVPLFAGRYAKGSGKIIQDLEGAAARMCQAADLNELRGMEGAAARKIFGLYNGFLDDPAFHMSERRRKSPDRINSLLNLGYYLLFSRINAIVRAMGMNPYLGFLHGPENTYESLVCDIQELFRARIDRLIIRVVNLKQIKPEDYTETERGIYLKRDAVKTFIGQFEAGMDRKKPGELSLKEHIHAQAVVIRDFMTSGRELSLYRWQA